MRFQMDICECERAVSSVGLERRLDRAEVVGSNPIPPTILKTSSNLILRRFFSC